MLPCRLVWAVRRWRTLAYELAALLWAVLLMVVILCLLAVALWVLLWLAASASEVMALLSLLLLLDRSRACR